MGFGFCTSVGMTPARRCAVQGIAGIVVMVVMVVMATLGSTAHAQLVPSASAASAPVGDSMERAQRQADNVMRWIKVHSDKPRTSPAKPVEPTAPQANKSAHVAPQKTAAVEAPVADPVKPVAAAAAEPVEPVPVVAPSPVAPPVAASAAVAKAQEPPPEEDEIPLKAIAQDQPVIPRNTLASLNAVAKVMVQFTVETNGNVRDVQVLSSNRSQLNRPTITAVSQWRFEPIKAPRIAQVEFDFAPER